MVNYVMNGLVISILFILIFVVLFTPKIYAALAVVSGVIYITLGPHIDIAGFNVTGIRLVVAAGFVRILIRKEFAFSRLTEIDKSILIFYCLYLLLFLMRTIIQQSSTADIWYRVGSLYDSIATYFTFRGLVNTPADLKNLLKKLSILIMPFAVLMAFEAVTGRNIFYIMGGVPETSILREGQYRCQGSFGIAITAGSFGATLIPLFVMLTLTDGERAFGVIGMVMCLVITIASHSSGPLMAIFASAIAWMWWPFREKMKITRLAIVALFLFAHLIMKAPVWFFFARLSDVFGGDGWHRSNLIDKFVTNFDQWWLMGMSMEQTANWAATKMPWGAVDVTNEYVAVGLNGGLISLFLFISLLVKCYQCLGKSMLKLRLNISNSRTDEILLWGLGCALFSNTVNLTAVTYWDQFNIIWLMLLALIASTTSNYLRVDEAALSIKPPALRGSV
jgi:hypothetical protein